jgi:hypothetical protein
VASEEPFNVTELIQQLQCALIDPAPDQLLPFTALVNGVFGRQIRAERRVVLWTVAERVLTAPVNERPHLDEGERALWRMQLTNVGVESFLSGACVALVGDAWCKDSFVHVTHYSEHEHSKLRLWRCHGPHILRQVFVQSIERLPAYIRDPHSSLPLLRSEMQWNEGLRHYAATGQKTIKQLTNYNRKPFTRLQVYGVSVDPTTQHTAVFFLPAMQILKHMQDYFLSSSIFELRTPCNSAAYVKHVKFTNLMLLNLLGHGMRQITTLFRMHEASDPHQFLIPMDDIYELNNSSQVNTLTEEILGQQEPHTWLSSLSGTLQHAVQSFAPHAVVADSRPRVSTTRRRKNDRSHAQTAAATAVPRSDTYDHSAFLRRAGERMPSSAIAFAAATTGSMAAAGGFGARTSGRRRPPTMSQDDYSYLLPPPPLLRLDGAALLRARHMRPPEGEVAVSSAAIPSVATGTTDATVTERSPSSPWSAIASPRRDEVVRAAPPVTTAAAANSPSPSNTMNEESDDSTEVNHSFVSLATPSDSDSETVVAMEDRPDIA